MSYDNMRDCLPLWEDKLDKALGLEGQPPEVIELVHRSRIQGFEWGEDGVGRAPTELAPRDGKPVFFLFLGGLNSGRHGGQWPFCWVEGQGWVQDYSGSSIGGEPRVLQDEDMDYWIPQWTASKRDCDLAELLP